MRGQNERQKHILCDPQTSGGLLLAVEPDSIPAVKKCLKSFDLDANVFGKLNAQKEKLITVY